MTYSERNYGSGDPDCPVCHGVGYIRYDVPEEHEYFGRVFDCDCRRAQVDAERINHLRRLGGLEMLADKTFDTFSPEGVHEGHRANLRMAYERCVAYSENPDGWLLITGGYGCGKTHLAAAIANELIAHDERVLFVTAPDLLDHLRMGYDTSQAEGGTYSARFEMVRDVPLLVLDDLGIESPTPWAREKLYQVLNHRYNARLPTVITTNHDVNELELRLRSRLSDLEVTQQIRITAPDYRKGGATDAANEVSDLDLYHHMTFDSFETRRSLGREERDNLRFVLETAMRYAEEPDGWLIFMGPYACGKTHLAAAIANERAEQGREAMFITVPNLLDHLRSAFAPNSHTSYDKRFHEVKTARLLVLDDLGMESATPWAREKLYQLFNHRYNARLPTVITTSSTLDKLDPRLVTRLRDHRLSRILAITAPAYQGERSRG